MTAALIRFPFGTRPRAPEPLSLWTVSERPRDYPQGFLARRWAVTQDGAIPTEDVVKAPTLAECRAGLPRGLVPMPRHDDDAAAIVEVWL